MTHFKENTRHEGAMLYQSYSSYKICLRLSGDNSWPTIEIHKVSP